VKCFVNQKSEEGVNLCLTCLQGGCDRHSQLHAKLSQHPLVLNFKARLKPKNPEPEEKPKEITRLAIGKPGGADFSDEEWELITELKCIPCGKRLDPAPFQGVIDSIIKAESASLKDAISAWELEIKPCAHTMTLEQTNNQKLADKSLAHCAKCELSSNLWLCLFCGFLGCGRKNFDGTGGNNHAREHSNETGHTLVVKLGTITPDGNASVHCYGCDEEVQDENLAEHLANFGINIAKLQKTEKTVTELNLQMNLNLTLSSVIERGRKITPLFGEGYTGMQNLGNSCYMNSVLQSLFILDEFKERYYKDGLKHLETCTSYTPECFICQMSKIGYGLYSGDYSQKKNPEPMQLENQTGEIDLEPYQDGIRPYMFKMLVGKGHPEFSTERQQDATEYLRHLFSFVQKAEKKAQLNDITKIFDFKCATQLTCQNCHGYKLAENLTQDIQLPIPKSNEFKEEEDLSINSKEVKKIPLVKFESCLDNFQTEFVSLNCPKCKSSSTFQKNMYFKTWPKYLIVVMSRILLDDWVPKKDISEIVFNSEVLDLSRFKLPQLDPSMKLEDEAQEEAPQFNQEALDQLQMMGFGENRAKRALLEKGNNVEEATNWLFEKMDDPSLDEPLPTAKKQGGAAVSQEVIDMITMMGFTDAQARYALSQTNNDPERAADYLFNHPEVDDLINQSENKKESNEQEMEIEDSGVYNYRIKTAVVHLGGNYSSGHYVCYVKKDGKWIYYNDSKVAESTDPAIGKGVLFLLERCSS
jgi:ubiquitin carboxyl-terminal hydrolase 5/13